MDAYETRVGRAYAAETLQQLRELFTDLPRLGPHPVVEPARQVFGGFAVLTMVLVGGLLVMVWGISQTEADPLFIIGYFALIFLAWKTYLTRAAKSLRGLRKP